MKIAKRRFSLTNPAIVKPRSGLKKECFILVDPAIRAFIKFDVPVNVLRRLSETGISPKLLGSGSHKGVSYVIQEFVQGIHPDRKWIAAHVLQLASIIQSYHNDKYLKQLLSKYTTTDYKTHLSNNLTVLFNRLANTNDPDLADDGVKKGFEQLRDVANMFSEVSMVPVHCDPNFKNMLLDGERLLFIDWDEITLSDPIRDIGVILWWFLPQDQWPLFFYHYRLAYTEETERKIYWFAARISLEMAIWYSENGYGDKGFIPDFFAALNCQPNPRQ